MQRNALWFKENISSHYKNIHEIKETFFDTIVYFVLSAGKRILTQERMSPSHDLLVR